MAAGRRRRRRGDRPKTRTASRKEASGLAATVHDVPDHLLELIFLRLDSCATVVRAGSACKRWCRVLAGAGFLSRFGSLRAPVLAGHYHTVNPFFDSSPPPAGGMPGFVPSATTAATVNPRGFSLDFLPDSKTWEIADSRGSLLLCQKTTPLASWTGYYYLPDQFIVCEPVTRRHQGILSPPYLQGECIGLFLLDGGDDNIRCSGGRRIGMSNFKILFVLHEFHRWVYGRGVPLACAFSSGSDGGWRVLQSAASENVTVPHNIEQISFAGRAGGSAYWAIGEDGAMLVLDEATEGFSVVMFPEDLLRSYDRYNFQVTGGEDGALRIVRLLNNELKVFARRHGSDDWVFENLVQLPEATRGLPGRQDGFFRQHEALIVAAESTHVLVTPQEKTWPFSVDLETMEVERARERNKYAGTAFPYELPWPPVLMACAERGRRSRR
ncbi:hypothetical protein SEVIR_2G183700v4 [Setaria viridis]|uniref:F-box domain-containing protein n=1 Tax=Setaria viridis TaxID=4556 RepID=A0A4U6VUQ6_SETVI|nr:hypothetical protein SEVIR_2G183700v2 [Setaria viridis]